VAVLPVLLITATTITIMLLLQTTIMPPQQTITMRLLRITTMPLTSIPTTTPITELLHPTGTTSLTSPLVSLNAVVVLHHLTMEMATTTMHQLDRHQETTPSIPLSGQIHLLHHPKIRPRRLRLRRTTLWRLAKKLLSASALMHLLHHQKIRHPHLPQRTMPLLSMHERIHLPRHRKIKLLHHLPRTMSWRLERMRHLMSELMLHHHLPRSRLLHHHQRTTR